jgi:hypothetical protein
MDAAVSFSTDSGNSGGRLGFIDLVLESFAFLSRLGFVVSRREATCVRFENDDVFVNVYHGRSSHHVGLELGLLQDSEAYSLHELLAALAPAHIEYGRCQTADSAVLARCLRSIAETIEQTCDALLVGDANAFEKLSSVVSPLRHAATLQAQFGAIIHRADRAWESKDFLEAAALYEKSASALDDTQIRRLEYLRKQMKI